MFNNSSKIYLASTSRLFSLWIGPLAIQLVFVFIYTSSSKAMATTSVAIFLWLIATIGSFSFLFFNHLQYAQKIKIIIDGKRMEFQQGDQTFSFLFSEIQTVTEYSISKLPWSGVFYWKIKTSEKEFVVSNLTISRLNFERYFHNKTEHVTSFFPILQIV